MVVFIVGTTAELIKIAPVFHACRRHGEAAIWFTGFHVRGIPELMKRLDLPEPSRWLARGVHDDDVQKPADVPAWLSQIWRSVAHNRRDMRRELAMGGALPLVVVHGDTFTTVVGTVLGRILRARVAHVEAGLRSGSLRSPFPEEANRRLAGRLVDIHFAPTPREVDNLRDRRGVVVLTGANTVVDSLKQLRSAGLDDDDDLPPSYGLATLHRFELLQDRTAFTAVLELLVQTSRRLPILFFAGAPERERIERYGLGGMFDERLRLLPKLTYGAFLPVLARAEFVVTDSGGLQEECAYLGTPCVVHRERTERHQGLGRNVVLSAMDLAVVQRFLEDPAAYRESLDLEGHRPSDIIAETLVQLGHL